MRRKPRHVRADLGQDRRRGGRLDARQRLRQRDLLVIGAEAVRDLLLQGGDRLLQEVNVRQDVREQRRVVRLHAASQRLAQLRQLGA